MSRRLTPIVALLLLAALGAPWPDDWDAVGFVGAVTRFDLAAFQPHPPGYPVYVALCRLIHLVGVDAVHACDVASAVGGALCVLALLRATGSWAGSLLALASPGLWIVSTSARSDALGLGLVALGAAEAIERPAISAGLLALALGARPSLAPLVMTAGLLAARPWAPGARRRTLVVAGVSGAITSIWVVGLLHAAGGFARYEQLARTQLVGHMGTWGETIVTRPDLHARTLAAARSVFVWGLGTAATPAGVTRAFAWATLIVMGVRRWGTRRVLTLVGCLIPYATWVAVGQNPDEPRHVLPIVLALVVLAAEGLRAADGFSLRPWDVVWRFALVVWLMVPAVSVAWIHRTTPPPGVQAAQWMMAASRGHFGMLFGSRAARVAGWAGMPQMPRTWMGEVDVTLERLDRLPDRVWVTDEVLFRDRAMGSVGAGHRFCRDARVDVHPCVTVYPYDVMANLRH